MNPKKLPPKTVTEIQRRGRDRLTYGVRSSTARFRSGLLRFVPYPVRSLFPTLQEDIKDYFKKSPIEETEHLEKEEITPVVVVPTTPSYEKYRCIHQNPLSCEQPRLTQEADPEAKICEKCSFPTLLKLGSEIQGKRGRYKVTSYLGRRGMGRLYGGIQGGSDRPVVLKEYLLPSRYFNATEAFETKRACEGLGGLNLADGRVHNYRSLSPMEAIGDRIEDRCYLVTKGIEDSYPTLRFHLANYGAMTDAQVRHILNQVLQSLESLHAQKFRLPTGQVQLGLTHGNLSLDSLLISPPEPRYFVTPQFLIYLCDLSLWERLFNPPPNPPYLPQPTEDLKALGYISFYLLAGRWQNSPQQPLDPKDSQNWSNNATSALKNYIFRLIASDPPNPIKGGLKGFSTAEEARQALLQLPVEVGELRETPLPELPAQKQPKKNSWRWLLALLALFLLGGTLWWWFTRRQPALAEMTKCCISEVAAVPDGKFSYSGVKDGVWSYVLEQKNLVLKDETFEDELARRRPKLQLKYLPEVTGEEAIALVRKGEVDFAISSLVDDLPDNLLAQPFTYDGIAVYVAFSYNRRDNSLPQFLKGQITFPQLRQLYTGQITNWRELGGPDLPVKLYIPSDPEAVRIFEQRVLKDEQAIAQFRSLQQSEGAFFTSSEKIVQRPTIPTLRTVLREFEADQIGAIGFGSLSQVFGQCSVYPLALVDGNNAVQPLIQDNGQAINPSTDLCNQKGSYKPNISVFQNRTYPLAYPISVVYLRDNSRPPIGRKFAEILKTDESQRLLSKTGLVPLQPLK